MMSTQRSRTFDSQKSQLKALWCKRDVCSCMQLKTRILTVYVSVLLQKLDFLSMMSIMWFLENDWGWDLGDPEIDALQIIRFICLKKVSLFFTVVVLGWAVSRDGFLRRTYPVPVHSGVRSALNCIGLTKKLRTHRTVVPIRFPFHAGHCTYVHVQLGLRP